jgi:hypothetical protein|tara:strand:- start:716 stop:853 length:138 start_codon:yes stop_codon:yes gene_type:complete
MKLEKEEYSLIEEFTNKLTKKLEKAREEYGKVLNLSNIEMKGGLN